jgi:hypothetical protein
MSTTAKRVRELEAEIGRLDFGRAPPPCLDEACEYLRAYADSLERPCMDREPPHCPSCNCGAPDELKKGDL